MNAIPSWCKQRENGSYVVGFGAEDDYVEDDITLEFEIEPPKIKPPRKWKQSLLRTIGNFAAGAGVATALTFSGGIFYSVVGLNRAPPEVAKEMIETYRPVVASHLPEINVPFFEEIPFEEDALIRPINNGEDLKIKVPEGGSITSVASFIAECFNSKTYTTCIGESEDISVLGTKEGQSALMSGLFGSGSAEKGGYIAQVKEAERKKALALAKEIMLDPRNDEVITGSKPLDRYGVPIISRDPEEWVVHPYEDRRGDPFLVVSRESIENIIGESYRDTQEETIEDKLYGAGPSKPVDTTISMPEQLSETDTFLQKYFSNDKPEEERVTAALHLASLYNVAKSKGESFETGLGSKTKEERLNIARALYERATENAGSAYLTVKKVLDMVNDGAEEKVSEYALRKSTSFRRMKTVDGKRRRNVQSLPSSYEVKFDEEFETIYDSKIFDRLPFF